jgi:quercetin dioxygenase-like cupin family protein
MHITRLDYVKRIKPDMEGAKGIYKQIPISRDNGTPTVSFRVFTIDPGGHTPLHTHPFEHVNYVIEGHGTLINGNSEHELNKGDFVLVLPGETHQYRNTSEDKIMLLICAVPKEYE